ncbi:hypothetical protein FIBSPDRAFT_508603 [Athelia psychrophila]|uniref:Fido domain-containing protein n=1 Tax=Athelia psychrophila TaxID=1759441 RepID=A0A166JWK1_9AGAM|nr:hypothetical protein FIBSPDRAFT_508603 [Fibularhizoctonia sp. CBS 109695]
MDMPQEDSLRVKPFNVSRFSSHALSSLPEMEAQDRAQFLESLKADTIPELAATVRLWEQTLLPRYRIPFFLVRVADVRAALNSTATALILYKEAQAQLDRDPVFDDFVDHLSSQCHADEENHRQTYSQGVFNQPWRGTSHYRFPIIPWAPDQMDDIKERWAVMRGKTREQQLLRHITIETNLLESAFSLTSASMRRLIREGFEEHAVELLPESVLNDTSIVVSILRDSHKALELVLSVAHDPSKLSVELILELHTICMKTVVILPVLEKQKVAPGVPGKAEFPAPSLRTEVQELTGKYLLKYSNIELTRLATKKNVVIPGPPRVQFCPFDDVVSELGRFVHLARQWLKNWPRNPFASAAWIHLVIGTIHPFENGNGRVARLVASIPFITANLPPVCVLSNSQVKKDYFEGIGKAREDDYALLIQCFVKSLETSVGMMEVFE